MALSLTCAPSQDTALWNRGMLSVLSAKIELQNLDSMAVLSALLAAILLVFCYFFAEA